MFFLVFRKEPVPINEKVNCQKNSAKKKLIVIQHGKKRLTQRTVKLLLRIHTRIRMPKYIAKHNIQIFIA